MNESINQSINVVYLQCNTENKFISFPNYNSSII